MSNDLVIRLRQQADALEAAARMPAIAPPDLSKPYIPPQPAPSIQELIAAEVARQMAPQPAINPMATMLGLLGQAFTSEQQLWISANVGNLPAFIQSSNGKVALGMLLEEFQTFVKPK